MSSLVNAVPRAAASSPPISSSDITALVRTGTIPSALANNPQADIIREVCDKMARTIRSQAKLGRLMKSNLSKSDQVIDYMSSQFQTKIGKRYRHKFGAGKSAVPGRTCLQIGWDIKAVVVYDGDASTKKSVSQSQLVGVESDQSDEYDCDFD